MPSQGHSPLAPLACTQCKVGKRRCDKSLPKCSLCISKNLPCTWSGTRARRRRRLSPSAQFRSPDYPRSETRAPSITTSEPPQQGNEFPAVFYLDWDVFQKCNVELPRSNVSARTCVSPLIGEFERWEAVSSTFFATIHSWMPIISRKRFYEHLSSNSSGSLRSDYALLILCMDLITWIPSEQNWNPRGATYMAAKSFYLDLEIAGIVSIQALQAGILIALFEFGHAMYPSAAVSLGACARYGYALGINWNTASPSKPLFSWVDLEEQNRVWWAIVMLDRLSRIGYPRRSPLTEDPSENVSLPADDADWDEGVMPTKKIGILSSHSVEDLGSFALAAETTRLLAQVLRHISLEVSDDRLYEDEALLLDRALHALIAVVECDGNVRRLKVMNESAMCRIALVILHEAHSSKNTGMSAYFDSVHQAKKATEHVTRSREEINEHSWDRRPMDACVKEASPFLTTLLYQTAIANLRLQEEKRTQESSEALAVIKAALKDFNKRWRASGEYLKILEAREISYMR